jgi:hypothetical protein
MATVKTFPNLINLCILNGKCPVCNGVGYTVEHNPDDPHDGGVCSGGCPIQVECEQCEATGIIHKEKHNKDDN